MLKICRRIFVRWQAHQLSITLVRPRTFQAEASVIIPYNVLATANGRHPINQPRQLSGLRGETLLAITEQTRIITSGNAEVVPLAALAAKLSQNRPLTIKLGVDPTAPDLHLGHAVPLRKLRQLQDIGHQVVLIIGDGTALVGDPSGRNSTRPPLSPEQIAAHADTYVSQAFKILDVQKTELRYNSQWLNSLSLEQLLKLTAQFTVARILERDDFSQRYQDQRSILLHEFLYPVMQAYDSVVVQADIEIGGTDQLFNLLAGRELMEKLGMEPQVCLTTTLS